MLNIAVTVPDGRQGEWSVETLKLTEQDVALDNMRWRMRRQPHMVCHPGTYKRLVHDRRGTVMSNTTMEVLTNRPIIRAARGDVLVNGLGLGMVLAAILQKPEVRHVTVVELDKDVIALVGPHFAEAQSKGRLTIVHHDCFTYQPPKGARFDAVWHDIWDEISSDNLSAMTRLKRKYGRRCDWQGCWSEDLVRT